MHLHEESVFLCIDGKICCQTQLNPIDPKEKLGNKFVRILRDFDNDEYKIVWSIKVRN